MAKENYCTFCDKSEDDVIGGLFESSYDAFICHACAILAAAETMNIKEQVKRPQS